MRTRTLTQLIADVRARADMEGDGHVTDAMITVWLNQGIADLWDMLVFSDPERHYVTDTISTTTGTESYVLPDDFYQMRGVDVEIQGRRYPIEPLQFQERLGPLTDGDLAVFGAPVTRYQVRSSGIDGSGTRLYFDPDPGTHTYRIHYVQAPQLLASGTDELDGVAGWEDYPVEFARKLALERQEQDSSPAHAALEQLRGRIRKMASLRDAGGSPRIADVRGRNNLRFRSL